MTIQLWIVIIMYVINVLFTTIMIVVSPLYKKQFNRVKLQILKISWLCIMIGIIMVFLLFNMHCLTKCDSKLCNILSWVLVGLVILVTIWLITFGIINEVRANNLIKNIQYFR